MLFLDYYKVRVRILVYRGTNLQVYVAAKICILSKKKDILRMPLDKVLGRILAPKK